MGYSGLTLPDSHNTKHKVHPLPSRGCTYLRGKRKMAKNSTRTKMKDELTAAVNNLDWYIAKLDKIFETYQEAHPDIALGAAMAIKSAIMLKEFTENINKEI